jgi:hypothetical protein
MREEIAKIVRDNIHLLRETTLDNFYANIPKWSRGEVTHALLQMGVDPLSRVKDIPDCLYYEISGVSSITIPDNVNYIRASAFANMADLESVVIPKNIMSIDDSAFLECEKLSAIKFSLPGKLTYIGHDAFARTAVEKIVIPGSVSVIGSGAFYWCKNLKEAILMEGVDTIGPMTFVECRNLSYLSLPRTIRAIEVYAFQCCKKLDKIYYSGPVEEFEYTLNKFPKNWAFGSSVEQVICSDGVVPISEITRVTA